MPPKTTAVAKQAAAVKKTAIAKKAAAAAAVSEIEVDPQMKKEVQALSGLRKAVVGLKSRFVVSGHANVGNKVYVEAEGDGGDKADVFSMPADAARLYQAGALATFGRGKEEVLDPDYRSARAFKPNKFQVHVSDLFAIVHDVTRALLPNNSDAVYLVPEICKLNVYKEGDKFKPHVDTITNNRLVASLVLCLPSSFTGGELVVSHGDSEHMVQFGSSDANADENKLCNWAAFYTDCVHEILPVISGYRVSVTYNLLAVKDSVQHLPLVVDSPVKIMLSEVVKSGFKGKLAIPAQHAYPHTSGLDFQLKGADAVIYSAAKSLDVGIKLVPAATSKNLLKEAMSYKEPKGQWKRNRVQLSDSEDSNGDHHVTNTRMQYIKEHGFEVGGLFYHEFTTVDARVGRTRR